MRDVFEPPQYYATLCALPCNAWEWTAPAPCWWGGFEITDLTSTKEEILLLIEVRSADGADLLTIPAGHHQQRGEVRSFARQRPWRMGDGETLRISMPETPKARFRLEVALWELDAWAKPTREDARVSRRPK